MKRFLSIMSCAIFIISTASLIAVAAVAYVILLSSDNGAGAGAGARRARGGSGGGGDAGLMSPATVAAAAAVTGVAVASTVDALTAGAGCGINNELNVLLQCSSVRWCHGLLVTSFSCAAPAVSAFPSLSKHKCCCSITGS